MGKLFMIFLGCFFWMCITSWADEFVIKNENEFSKIVSPNAEVKKLAGGFQFVEGPVWVNEKKGYLIFSDIPANRLIKWTKQEGAVTFRQPSNNANGNYLNLEGKLLTCEHVSRQVTVTEKDGTIQIVVDKYNGKKLNSPNDLVVKSDGTIWFTDPPYGLPYPYDSKAQPANYVFRLDPQKNKLTAVVDDFDMPNGLCFSPDEKKLYIADSGKPHHIRVFDVNGDNTLSNDKVFCVIDKGGPDGIRCDVEANLYSSAKDGVHIFAPDGSLIGKILVPETPANLCFGGKEKKILFITARTSLYSIKLKVKGAQKP